MGVRNPRTQIDLSHVMLGFNLVYTRCRWGAGGHVNADCRHALLCQRRASRRSEPILFTCRGSAKDRRNIRLLAKGVSVSSETAVADVPWLLRD